MKDAIAEEEPLGLGPLVLELILEDAPLTEAHHVTWIGSHDQADAALARSIHHLCRRCGDD